MTSEPSSLRFRWTIGPTIDPAAALRGASKRSIPPRIQPDLLILPRAGASTTFAEPAAAVHQFECRNACKTWQCGHAPNLSMVPSNQYDIGINLRRMEQFGLTNLP